MKVALIMGSISDQEIVKKCARVLQEFNVEYDVQVISAHRSMGLAIDYVSKLENNEIEIMIAFAGKAAHLAGVLAGLSTKPVIGVPVKASTLDGLDALLSTVQMPKGVPVATVAIDGAENAAILAIEMLAISDSELKEKLVQYKQSLNQAVLDMNTQLEW